MTQREGAGGLPTQGVPERGRGESGRGVRERVRISLPVSMLTSWQVAMLECGIFLRDSAKQVRELRSGETHSEGKEKSMA